MQHFSDNTRTKAFNVGKNGIWIQKFAKARIELELLPLLDGMGINQEGNISEQLSITAAIVSPPFFNLRGRFAAISHPSIITILNKAGYLLTSK